MSIFLKYYYRNFFISCWHQTLKILTLKDTAFDNQLVRDYFYALETQLCYYSVLGGPSTPPRRPLATPHVHDRSSTQPYNTQKV